MAWLTGWNYRKQLTVNGTTGPQSDYQMKLTVNQGSGTDSAGVVYCGGNILTSFNDLRFTKSDGSTPLNYWIESTTGSSPNQATVWIKLAPAPDTIPVSPGTYSFYMYYNNSLASAGSNGTNTFIIFDDFSSNSNADWTQVQGTQYFQVQNYRMEHLTGFNPSPYWGAIVKGLTTANTPKFVMEYTANTLASGCQRGYGWMIWSDSSHYIGFCSVGGTGCGNATQNAGYTVTINQSSYLSASEKKAQVIYDGSTIKTYFDGTLYWMITVTLQTNNRFGFYEQESGASNENPAYWKTFRVRNYSSPEPTWSSTITTQATLNITSSPTGAEVWLRTPAGSGNYIDQGIKTNTTIGVTPGTYDVELILSGGQTWYLMGQTFNAGNIYNIQATFPGQLTISSTPSGAEVFLGGVDRHVTTNTTISGLNPSPPDYNITLKLDGYQDWAGTATVYANLTTTVISTFAGSAYITSTPTGAAVYLDGSPAPIGNTPLTVTNLTPSSSGATTLHTYILKFTGYADTSGSFTATAGQTLPVSVTFTGSLYITSMPTGASIYIDGVLQ